MLEEIAVVSRGKHEDAGLHDVRLARGEPKVRMEGTRTEPTLPEALAPVAAFRCNGENLAQEVLAGFKRRVSVLVRRADFLHWHTLHDRRRARIDQNVGIDPDNALVILELGEAQNQALLPGRASPSRAFAE